MYACMAKFSTTFGSLGCAMSINFMPFLLVEVLDVFDSM